MNRSNWVGIGLTVVFHALLLTLCFSSGLKYLYPPPQEQAFLMEFPDDEPLPQQMEVGNEPRSETPDPDREVQLVKRSESPVQGTKANEAPESTVGEDGDVEVPEPKREIDRRALFPSAANNKKDTLAQQTSSQPSPRFDEGHASGNTMTGSSDGEPRPGTLVLLDRQRRRGREERAEGCQAQQFRLVLVRQSARGGTAAADVRSA